MDNNVVMIPLPDVIEMLSMEVTIEIPDRNYIEMTPLQCYQAGLVDAGTSVRRTIREALEKKYLPEKEPE